MKFSKISLSAIAVISAVGMLLPHGSLAQTKAPSGLGTVDVASLKPISEMEGTIRGAVYADPSAPASERVHDLIRRMTFEEKLAMTGGWNKFLTHGVERLGIRPVSMADASQGIRVQTSLIKTPTTSFPGMLPMASTWNRELIAEMAAAIADECRSHGVDILLGPGINLQRLSVGGRNYEYFGEDPFLTGEMATSYVKALQGRGIISCPKHFLGNDQDFCRHVVNYTLDERTLREIYLLPWEKVITEGGALAVMTGNNSVNGYHNVMNRNLLQETLRDDFGFKGMIMTDWQNSSYFPALQRYVLTSGGTLMMPDNNALMEYVKAEAASSYARKAEIEVLVEKMIYPTLYALFEMGIFDRQFNDMSRFESTAPHEALAARCATEAMVLLRNEKNILPIKDNVKTILLAGVEESTSGTGSGFVKGYNHVSFEDGLRAEFGDRLIVSRTPSDAEIKKAGVILFCINKPAGEGYDVPFEKGSEQIEALEHILTLNKNVVVLISACNSIPTVSWANKARGIVWTYFLGQQRGTALASLLSGKENFSGKLPFTIEQSFKDSCDPEFNYIGGKPYWRGNNEYRGYWLGIKKNVNVEGFSKYIKPGEMIERTYPEGIYMGYRWAEKKNIPCTFRFGDGLSYTSFSYESAEVVNNFTENGTVKVNVTVRNTGKREGAEIVQVYVREMSPAIDRPDKELKGFGKVLIPAGESATVSVTLDDRSFSWWSSDEHCWKHGDGPFEILAGGSLSTSKVIGTVTLN